MSKVLWPSLLGEVQTSSQNNQSTVGTCVMTPKAGLSPLTYTCPDALAHTQIHIHACTKQKLCLERKISSALSFPPFRRASKYMRGKWSDLCIFIIIAIIQTVKKELTKCGELIRKGWRKSNRAQYQVSKLFSKHLKKEEEPEGSQKMDLVSRACSYSHLKLPGAKVTGSPVKDKCPPLGLYLFSQRGPCCKRNSCPFLLSADIAVQLCSSC